MAGTVTRYARNAARRDGDRSAGRCCSKRGRGPRAAVPRNGLACRDIHRDFEAETHVGIARCRPLHRKSLHTVWELPIVRPSNAGYRRSAFAATQAPCRLLHRISPHDRARVLPRKVKYDSCLANMQEDLSTSAGGSPKSGGGRSGACRSRSAVFRKRSKVCHPVRREALACHVSLANALHLVRRTPALRRKTPRRRRNAFTGRFLHTANAHRHPQSIRSPLLLRN